ncbi:MAG: hypothetical protein HZA93_05050 [Verrucomicrobia bacterium]|nr:hypothetical protein [Verrucomicrobiota bacterium]
MLGPVAWFHPGRWRKISRLAIRCSGTCERFARSSESLTASATLQGRLVRCALSLWLTPLTGGIAGQAQEGPAPVIFQSGAGRFEVAATDAAAAQWCSAQAAEAWDLLNAPLALPERFSPPIFVRLVPAADWREPAAFRVTVEPAGVVSLRLRWVEPAPEATARRALVQALLMRLAVARHGVNDRLAVPLWLEIGCVEWWITRAAPAQWDAWKAESAGVAPPAIGDMLAWRRGETETRERQLGALGLLTFLQSESVRETGWPELLMRLLAGDAPEPALRAAFPGRFANAPERELWWQTGWHHLRRANTLPALSAPDSRVVVGEAARFVFARDDGSDFVLPLAAVLERNAEPLVEIELNRRAAELNRVMASLHPFYRNAGLSLAAALGAPRAGKTARRAELARTFADDWRDATELEAATSAALDAPERK